MSLEDALIEDDAFFSLVETRAHELGAFLRGAAWYEADGPSLRLERRPDLDRCRQVLPLFREAWWGVVVYSCFDSISGTETVAPAFGEPLPVGVATRVIRDLDPKVQQHRAQVGRGRSRRSLVSACEKAEELKRVLTAPEMNFEERFDQLGRVHVWAWRRTTNFDALARAGVLQLDGVGYRPQRAYLHGSQGPAAGFEQVWGIPVTAANADQCEELLVRWTSTWEAVAAQVGVTWTGLPYDSADFENALCVLHEAA